ncbi:DUF6234 family protein [Streptomyces sp. NPDC006733]|uniref:DUF6234 family protein n=1 Tax=Streptomyces sp. NPDC006733 TaxID=3155460 RepID=UPI0033D47177
MNLPIAPPAFDDFVRPRTGRSADVGAAVWLLLLEVVALMATFGRWLVTAMSDDPDRPATLDPLWGYLVAAGAIAALALLAAVVTSRSHALVTVLTQCCVTVGVVNGVAVQRHQDRIAAPHPPSVARSRVAAEAAPPATARAAAAEARVLPCRGGLS